MCWRGHDPERRNKYGHCMDCHAILMRARRHGRQAHRMPRYRLNISEFHRLTKGRMTIVAQLAGISRDTVRCWLSGARHAGGSCATNRVRAEALTAVFGIPFDYLWTSI
jgi:hypothetical protein